MSTIVLDVVAAEIATLARLVPTPVEPFGYGTDLSCVSDLTETLDEIDPNSALGIAQFVARRLTTAKGSLADDEDFGLDVRGYLNRGVPTIELRDFAGQIRMEVAKDDRIEDCAVEVTAPTSSDLNISIYITPYDASLQPFSLTLAVTASDVLLQLEAAA